MNSDFSIETTTTSAPRTFRRQDVLSLWAGVIFSLAFTALIWWTGQRLAAVPHLPDQGPAWYYWRLANPSFWSHATAWGFYLLHQVTLWALIYYAQTRVKKYSTRLHGVNILALSANAFFIFLHLLQTQVWYDGLAQDVSIWSALGSVAVMLIWVLLMENQRRGMFFGYKLPIGKNIIRFARTYHGYFFAWATIYTFWYHPMENTSGHLIGFLYMFLLMLQGSLFFTRVHNNRYWTVFLEVLVLAHGTLVAILQGGNLWPMFAFGFGGVFVITQMHGLGFSRLVRGILLAAYLTGVAFVYTGRGWARVNEIIRIPFIDYLSVLELAGLIALGMWAWRKVKPLPQRI